jgi:hypothetical protein
MEAGGTWERLLHTPTTWIVVAVVLFVVAVVLLVAGAPAGRRAARARRAEAAAAARPAAADEDPVTEPSVPHGAPDVSTGAAEEDPVTEPAVSRSAESGPDPAVERLLGALVGDPRAALAGVAALERGEEPGRAAVSLLRAGVPVPAVARLCGVEADDLGDLVASTLGVLPDAARSVVEEPAAHQQPVSL